MFAVGRQFGIASQKVRMIDELANYWISYAKFQFSKNKYALILPSPCKKPFLESKIAEK